MKTYSKGLQRGFVITLLAVVLVSIIWSVSPAVVEANAAVFRVAPTGQDVATCGSAAQPCKTIQYAVNQASSGDTILVAKGTYTFNAAHDVCTGRIAGSSAVVCYFDKELTIRGGYCTSNWSTAAPETNLTIIDGQSIYRGVRLQKSYAAAPAASLHMEGFTIRNSLAVGKCSGTVDDINSFGAGLLSEHASVTLRHMVFLNNEVRGGTTTQAAGGAGAGGGVAVNTTWGGVTLTLDEVAFEGNRAVGGNGAQRGGVAIGGALFTYGIATTGMRLSFVENEAIGGNTAQGSGISGYERADAQGGAAAFHSGDVAMLQDVEATGNQALGGNAPNGEGGGAFGGALFVENMSLVVSGARIVGNKALGGTGKNVTVTASQAWGGGVTSTNANITLERVQVLANEARGGPGTVYGGAVSGGGVATVSMTAERRQVQIENSIIADNYAEVGTGALVGGGGGGVWFYGVAANVVHTTIARNSVQQNLLGQGIILVSGGEKPVVLNLQYSIVSDHTGLTNTAAMHAQCGTTVNLSRGLYANNTYNDNHDRNFAGAPGVYSGLSTMVQASSVKYVSPGAPEYDYHIRKDSPARNAATSSTESIDIDTQLRTTVPCPDIGADEYVPSFSVNLAPVASQMLRVNWEIEDPYLAGSVDHYRLALTCSSGAASPQQVQCGSHVDINVQEPGLTLTGLTDYKQYSVVLHAVDSNGQVLESSALITAFPTDHLIRLPFVSRGN
ncbi:MAG: hypothetical protein JXB35_13340 [Anaerolineae bacterium]|nr:hypothetical protein [Anaerolineae bacterium]